MLRSGLLLSRFELVSVLGRGGMGEVWRARDLRLGRDVAIKVLPAELAREPDRVARFEREARALAALNHPNVAQIYELGEAVPDPGPTGAAFDVPRVPVRFLVMELIEGESLARRLRGGALPLPDALRVAGQIARGLAAAHARGVIHRDLKPGNVMLSPGGEAKVLDFGLARFRPGRRPPEDVDVTARHGEPGSVVGTAAYMSPEQVRGEECDESCDAWGFGCCLAEMLTGARAFAGPTVPEIMGKVLDGRADLERLPPETPQEVRELLGSCLAGDRAKRPTLDQVAEVLDVTAAGKAAPARRARRWLAAAAMGVAAAAGIAWLASHPHAPARPVPLAGARLRVALDPVRAGTPPPPAGLAAVADDGFLRAVAERKTLELVAGGRSDVRVRPVAVAGAGGAKLHVTLVDNASGAVIAVLELPAGGRDGGTAARAVASALELEEVCRELARSDPLHAFLARRTRVLDAAAAFRDGVQLNARTRLAEAKQAFQRALAADPCFWPAHLYLALNAKATGHFGEWEGELAAARTLVPHPDEGEAVILEEVAAVLSEDSQRRLEAFERARAFFPESGELKYRAAQAHRLGPDAGRVGVLAASGGPAGRRAAHHFGGRGTFPDALQVPAVRGVRPAPARPRAAGARGARPGGPQASGLHEHEPARRASGGAVLGLAAALGRGAAPAVRGGARRGREGTARHPRRPRPGGRARRGPRRPRTVRRGERGPRAAGRRQCGRPGGVPGARPCPGRVGRPDGGPRRSRARRRAVAGGEGPGGRNAGVQHRGRLERAGGLRAGVRVAAAGARPVRRRPPRPRAGPRPRHPAQRGAARNAAPSAVAGPGHTAPGAEETWPVVRGKTRPRRPKAARPRPPPPKANIPSEAGPRPMACSRAAAVGPDAGKARRPNRSVPGGYVRIRAAAA